MKGIVVYPDPVKKFAETTGSSGGRVILAAEGDDVNEIIARQYPDAKVISSNLPEIKATLNPDTVSEASELDGTDVGVVRGTVGVAENGCVWIPQTMKERAVMFICEALVILLDSDAIVSTMHEAYSRINMTDYGSGTFISGPSKTADIEQALVMGAQAARDVTVILKL